jgi:CRP-like cAMP-binding protein
MQEDYMRRTYTDGEMIFTEGERGAEAFLINSGRVQIFKDVGGVFQEIDVIGPSQIFGEMGIVSDSNRMASARAIGKTVLTCCHRRELVRRVDQLNEDRRDALRFLIIYCQEFMPYELMENRPEGAETDQMDRNAFYLIRDAKKANELDSLDAFLKGLYLVLISYAERRLPPDYKP